MFGSIRKYAHTEKMPAIEMYGNRELIAEGCGCVCDYGADFIRLDFGVYEMTVRGTGLNVQSYLYEQIDITGIITAVEFGGLKNVD